MNTGWITSRIHTGFVSRPRLASYSHRHVIQAHTPLNGTHKAQSPQPEKPGARFQRAFISALVVFGLLAALIFAGWVIRYAPR